MPYKKSYKRYNRRKKRYFRKKKYSPQRSLLGNRQKITHRYFEQVAIDPGAGVTTGHVFTANGLFDPNITGTGSQPRGFDQIVAMFDHYTVIAARCTAVFTSPTSGILIGIAQRDNNTVPTAAIAYIEGRNVNWKAMGSLESTATIKSNMSIKNFLGRPNVLSEDDLRGSSTANPAEQAYFHVFVGSTLSNDPGSVTVQVLIEYVTIWTEPHNPTAS